MEYFCKEKNKEVFLTWDLITSLEKKMNTKYEILLGDVAELVSLGATKKVI